MASEPKAAPNVKAISAGANAAAGERPKLEPLKRGAADLFEIHHNAWRVVINADVTPQELDMHPTFWTMLAQEMREGDDVKAVWNNGKHVARYEVVNVVHGAVAARLAYAVEGAPLMAAVGPKPFPEGYHIAKARLEEGAGFVVVREKDGMRMMNSGGVPWKTHQDAYEEFLKSALFRTEQVVQRIP